MRAHVIQVDADLQSRKLRDDHDPHGAGAFPTPMQAQVRATRCPNTQRTATSCDDVHHSLREDELGSGCMRPNCGPA
jgi:hypothetical protein